MLYLIFNWWNIAVLVLGGYATFFCYKKYEVTKSRPLLTCLPGIYTSLGLLGTFCSICWSLYDIGPVSPEVIDNTGVTLADAQGKDIDIIEIISELIPAFTTSIIGLLGALGVTLWTKTIFAQEEQAQDEELLNNITPEEYIRDIALNTKNNVSILNEQKELLDKLLNLQKEQEEKNRQYNDKLNENIGHQSEILKDFIDGFVKRMDGIFQQMHVAIQQQVQDFGEEQFAKTSELLATITKKMSAISTDLISTQKKSVEDMMSNTNAEIGSITTNVTEVLAKLTTDIEAALASLGTEQSTRLNSIISNYDALAAKLSEQNNDFANKVTERLQSDYEKVQRHNLESLQQMVDLRNAYQEATQDVVSNTLNMNEKVTSDLRDSMTGFVQDIQTSISTQCSSLADAITSNVESLDKSYRFIESLVAEIKQNYDQAVLAYGDAVNVAHRTNELSEKTIEETNKSLSSVKETNEKIGQVLHVLVNRQDNIEQLTKQINSISTAIVQLQKLESMLNKIVNR
jgi:methyl-accepting chemotaxis protein